MTVPFELPDATLWLSVPVLALFGLCVGSFLNVVVHRLPMMMEREWWSDVAEYQLGDASAWSRAFGGKTPRPEVVGQAAGAIESALGLRTASWKAWPIRPGAWTRCR